KLTRAPTSSSDVAKQQRRHRGLLVLEAHEPVEQDCNAKRKVTPSAKERAGTHRENLRVGAFAQLELVLVLPQEAENLVLVGAHRFESDTAMGLPQAQIDVDVGVRQKL